MTTSKKMVERIQNTLDAKKLSWSKAATSIGLSAQAPAKWKKGQISKENLDKLAALLEVDVGWILNGKNTQDINSVNIKNFMNNHEPTEKEAASFDTDGIKNVDVVKHDFYSGYVWIDVVEVGFSLGIGESIEFHFDAIKRKYPIPPSFFQMKMVDHKFIKIITAKGDSMSDYIQDQDMVGIDISQTEIIDGEIYAVYFEGEVMIKQIFKEQGGSLILHSFNKKYRDKIITEQNGLNFKVIGRQVWRAG